MYNIPRIYPPQEDYFLSITQRLGKKTISGWTLVKKYPLLDHSAFPEA
jgi:hypothetical protein